jgi:class 3 adenylate cyclase/TolB-like protein
MDSTYGAGALDRSGLSRQRRTVVVIDVVESVRLMEADEAGQVDRWRRFVNEVQAVVLPRNGGRMVKSLGDGMLLEFETVRDAVSASLDMQRRVSAYNAGRPESAAMYLRVGVNVGEFVRDSIDIYGRGVNLAARIASLAGPGEIIVSADVRDQLVPGLDADAEDLGECYLKHVAEPVRVYRVGAPGFHPVVLGKEEALTLQPTIAVIPFSVQGEEHAVVGDLVADSIDAQLSPTAELRVISRLSCRAFADRQPDPHLIAAHLHADYLVSGTVYLRGERLVLSAELCETHQGYVVWGERVSGMLADLFDPQSTLTDRIARGVHDAILQREVQRARTVALPSLQSYSLLLGAVNLMHRQSRPDFERARELLEHLEDRHPRHATPKAWIAKCFAISAAQGWVEDPMRGAQAAHRHVEMALSCEPHNSLAWAIRGLLHGYVDVDFDAAEADCREALAHNPNESLAWLYLATLHGWRGRRAEAVDATRQALRLSPLDPMKYYFDSLAGAAMLGAHEYERAIEFSRRSIRSNRAHLSTFRVLALAQALSGDVESARLTIRELLEKDPRFSVSVFKRASPWRLSPDAMLLCEALREAGVPDD